MGTVDEALVHANAWIEEKRAMRMERIRKGKADDRRTHTWMVPFRWTPDGDVRLAIFSNSTVERDAAPDTYEGFVVETFDTRRPRGADPSTFIRPDDMLYDFGPGSRETDELTASVYRANAGIVRTYTNVRAVSGSAFMINRRGEDGKATRCACIALTVSHPGIIMAHDPPLPTTLSHDGVTLPVDIRQGNVFPA